MSIDKINMKKFVLASSSPRRKALMKLLDIPFECISPDVEEIMDNQIALEELAMNLARQKAKALNEMDSIVLGCDTIVEVEGKRLGKPQSNEEAFEMLRMLSGKKHRVITGCCLMDAEKEILFYKDAFVMFDTLSDIEIQSYIDTKEPFGKAGAYAIQGYGAKFISGIHGDYYAIMGLPVREIYKYLKEWLR